MFRRSLRSTALLYVYSAVPYPTLLEEEGQRGMEDIWQHRIIANYYDDYYYYYYDDNYYYYHDDYYYYTGFPFTP